MGALKFEFRMVLNVSTMGALKFEFKLTMTAALIEVKSNNQLFARVHFINAFRIVIVLLNAAALGNGGACDGLFKTTETETTLTVLEGGRWN
jgi:hypothetical protein